MPVEGNLELQKILSFLKEIGLDIIEKELETTFLPGLSLGPNCLYVDYDKLLYPGDILHEAGHLAVTTSSQRQLAGTKKIAADWPTQAEEIGAILWSFAAANHLQLPLEFVFHPHGYKNESDWLISNFTNENYIGLPFLEWIGLCLGKERAVKENKPAFPAMLKWMRD
ncbi:MBL fold metallo-hydrolase [Flavobacterium sp. CLA17]|uniref:MBL fold metallo-hydrolase n=1 Tax=Flavobacterium sp. CLA17 TaxID=2724135 RepID=UPI001491C57B|nr:MBL fold metallo-hydrolase [Flavobacterium sp. CLA17]QSB25218.1 MBL fold metallo-hydrolase [Flavobacterium sp. CLA17]